MIARARARASECETWQRVGYEKMSRTRVAICGAPRLRRVVERTAGERVRGVSRDNALIKCHESAPLCASAA